MNPAWFPLGAGRVTVRPPYQGRKSDGQPDDGKIEPMYYAGFQAPPRSTGPNAGLHGVLSLPHFCIDVSLPGPSTIQYHSQILNRHGAL